MTLQEVCCQRIQELCDERNISMNKLSILCGMTQSTPVSYTHLDVYKRQNTCC